MVVDGQMDIGWADGQMSGGICPRNVLWALGLCGELKEGKLENLTRGIGGTEPIKRFHLQRGLYLPFSDWVP